jgi:hypothetical protein
LSHTKNDHFTKTGSGQTQGKLQKREKTFSVKHAGCEALKASVSGVVDALDALVERGLTEEAKECARGALVQLTDRYPDVAVVDANALHIMMSYVRAQRFEYAILCVSHSSVKIDPFS